MQPARATTTPIIIIVVVFAQTLIADTPFGSGTTPITPGQSAGILFGLIGFLSYVTIDTKLKEPNI